MGMAASQARYLSLSARKTNTEYEGQQLNQQRLNLANQSADLFNQMLTMSVPTCPDSNNFTKLQYSWSDGINDEVISDFYQISIPNENFNYVVTSYHYENVYTGQSKKMNAPEIQAAKKNQFTDRLDKQYSVNQLTYHAESVPGAGDDSYTIVVTRNGVESTHIFKRMDSSIDSIEEIDAFANRTSGVIAGDRARHVDSDAATGTSAFWQFDSNIEFTGLRIANPNFNPEAEMNNDPTSAEYNMPYMEMDVTIDALEKFYKIDFDDENNRGMIEQLLAIYGDKYDPNKTYYAYQLGTTTLVSGTSGGEDIKLQDYEYEDPANPGVMHHCYEYNGRFYDGTDIDTANEVDVTGITLNRIDHFDDSDAIYDAAGNPIYAFICGEDVAAAEGSQGDIANIEVRTGDKTTYYSDGTYLLTAGELSAIDLTNPLESEWLDTIFFHREENNPTYSNFTAVGNCELNNVSIDQYNASEDMRIEIQQVLKDMKGSNPIAYANLASCFDPVTGEYIGGIYSFKMFGHTYYTTTNDLEAAVKGAYLDNAVATNGIDAQNRLMYYTSTYIKTKIENSRKALMETDGKGRFSSVKFEDDDTVYVLTCETITDEDAYNDAMNKYFYKQEQYDKAISDINAKNEIIQAEDRQLQLRLEQLGTEQTALQTEMEACQKVVSKSIESTFKTFGG